MSAYMCSVKLDDIKLEIGSSGLKLKAREVEFDSTRAFYATKE